MPLDSTTPGDGGPLSPEQQAELSQAGTRAKKILRAAQVATFNGWSIGVFAALTLPFALFSVTALVMGIGMAILARNEFHGRKLLRNFDPRGPQLLGRNQLFFMGLLVVYCLWSIYTTLSAPASQLPGLEMLDESIGELATSLTVTVYGIVGFLSVLFQGLNARYYFARTKMVQVYLEETPPWIVDLQLATAVL